MRLLIVGSNEVWSIENYYYNYLKDAGVTVEMVASSSYFLKYYHSSVINKIIYRAGLSNIYRKIRELIKVRIESFRPHVVWVFKGMEVEPELLHWIRNRGIKLVNYNPDSPFIFTDRGSGNPNVSGSIPLFDLHFTYNLSIKRKLEIELKLKASYLPFGYDLEDSLFAECALQDEVFRTCFLGTPDQQRVSFIKNLADRGIAVDVYGNNWNRFLKHPNVNAFKAIYGKEFWKVLRKYRVQLNLMRIHNLDSHNMRTFELGGIGGVALAADTSEQRLFFDAGSEIFFFKDESDCAKQIQYLQSLSFKEANLIRQRARRRSLSSGYTYRERAAQALRELNLLTT
jgi:spore maturation protein CgeB